MKKKILRTRLIFRTLKRRLLHIANPQPCECLLSDPRVAALRARDSGCWAENLLDLLTARKDSRLSAADEWKRHPNVALLSFREGNFACYDWTSGYLSPPRLEGYAKILKRGIELAGIRDADFPVNLSDRPVGETVLNFCTDKTLSHWLIPFSRFFHNEIPLDAGSTCEGIPWEQELELIKVFNNKSVNKISKAYFGGICNDFHDRRHKYFQFCERYPEAAEGALPICYPHYGGMVFPWERFGLKRSCTSHYVSQSAAWKYKYWVHIEGVAAADRLRYAIASNSIPLIAPVNYLEFYYFFLEAGKNFLPLDYKYGNLLDIVGNTSAQVSASIAAENAKFIERYLSPKAIENYLRAVILRYVQVYKGH